ncbi:choice-of-anchor J domain-containing protein, partial [Flavobacterium sp. HSC-61S13]|uniref:choice-of-anchor J domain-containing protein n=1 Tax=Flavobacterium sp. HSC-61S13 TaxID=2910963 RepID=UPI00209DC541
MKFRVIFLAGMVALLFSYWLYANEDVNRISSFSFKTLSKDILERLSGGKADLAKGVLQPGELFVEDFEGTSTWTFFNEPTNGWYIGTATQNGGAKSMYVSDNKGTTNTYSNGVKTIEVSFGVSPSITVPANATNYLLSFDWLSNGEGATSYNDDLSVWIVPATYNPVVGTKLNSNSGGVLLKDKLGKQLTFKRENIEVDLSAYAGTEIKIVYQWVNNMFTLYQPPASIDNIRLYQHTCKAPSNLKVSQITLNGATINWDATDASISNFEVLASTSQIYPLTNQGVVAVNGSKNHTFTGLVPSTYYYVWYRSVCSSSDKSYWQGPVKFMTVCGVFKTPFYETFDTSSLNFECWTYIQKNSTDETSFQLSTNYRMEGDRGLMFNTNTASKAHDHDSYAVTPTFDFDGGLYKLTYYYKTSPSGGNEFEVLLSKDGIDASKFTTVLKARQKYQKSDYIKETIFIHGITGKVNIAWHVNSSGSSVFHLDNVRLESVLCTEPLRSAVSDIKTNSAQFNWDDAIANEWEYAVVKSNSGQPTTAGTKVSQTTVVANKDIAGNSFTSDTQYDFYVRAKCLDGAMGEWMGPVTFKTACDAKNVPYKEGFDMTGESDLACWTILDINNDGTAYGNIWKQSQYTVYKGDRCMYYSGSSPENEDWLISPGFNLKGGLYAVTFYYQVNQNTTANLEVKLSTSGVSPASFTKTIGTTLTYKGPVYTKKVVYIDGVNGVANIGFHVKGKGGAIQIDEFSIEQTNCRIPDDLTITNIGTASVDLSWTDPTSTKWEYFLAVEDGLNTLPVGSGTNATTTSIKANRVNGTNAPLEPNKEYKIFVRSSCGPGVYSEWVGPIKFRTDCLIMTLPYQEGFNSDSETQYCWKIVDGNNDKPWYGGFGEWFAADYQAYEGDKSMYFTNLNGPNNDDWLMSPTFKFEKKKIYRVSYMHRTEPGIKSEFEVRLSTTGREKEKYTRVLLPNATYDNVPWKKHKFLLSDIDGDVSIAIYISNFKNYGSRTYIDDFRIEEVTTCTEPMKQGAENITGTAADIFWDNDFGTTNWEYYVRKKAFLIAPPLTNGIAINKNKVTVTKDYFGANLEGNTWYEFYVRTLCGDTSKTEWTGPYYFRTDCTFYNLPYWEGFNGDDNSLRCWTRVNGNSGASLWKQGTANLFEGSHSMNLTQSGTADSNDWFISPLFKNLDPTKTYRVKFNYKGTGSGTNEMEVLASTKTMALADFTQVIAPKMSYSSAIFKDGISYFTGISGDMYLAFRVSGTGAKNITIDNLFIDEVTTCGQPLKMEVKNILGTSVNLVWQDAFKATAWQYMIQTTKQIPPTAKDAGTPTSSSDFVATKDITGKNLEPNTDYVYFVRTDCGNGSFSEWTGPIAFTTACDIYTVPFVAGFNSNSKQLRCWTTAQGPGGTTAWTTNTTWPYEGDRLMQYSQTSATAQADGYLISPTIALEAGSNYVLKYYYKTDFKNMNDFEVLLSTTGTAISSFTTTLLSRKTYNTENYVQETIFIPGSASNVNIAWHTMTKGPMTVGIDYVTIEKSGACPEPTNVKVTDFTADTIDVEWTQIGGITQWEVFVTEYGTAIPAGAVGVVVNGTPKYKATGLTSGKAYHIYVRAKCAGGTDKSNWSTAVKGPTKVTTNGECKGAINIPVNSGSDCIKTIGVSTVGSPTIPTGGSVSKCKSYLHTNEMWFEFTATATSHLLSFKNFVGLNKLESPAFMFEVYSGQCATIFNSLLICEKFDGSYGTSYSKDDKAKNIRGLIPGNKYYVRVAVPVGDFLFTMCITTSEYKYVTVSKNGDKYTTEELVKDILIQSDCDLVSNVVYKAGPKVGGNTLGYFNQNGSLFPFEEGIVLATHDIATVPGPYYDYGDAGGPAGVRGKIAPWEGDEDLNAVIASAGGSVYAGSKSVATLEFDFVPIKDTIRFEYLMASESYLHNCTVVCWGAGALFTAWLTELETGQGQNLALVPGTNEPITLSTIRDTDRSGAANCGSVHPEFFGKYYGNGQDNPLLAPINYVGMTKPMSSEPVHVKPGVKYRIKLAMADFCNTNHISSVFFNARSFDLGNLDLGADLLIADNTAICASETKTIHSGIAPGNVKISWFKDENLIPGADKPDLEVGESGVYKAVAHYETINCEISGSVKVEMYPPLSDKIKPAEPIAICRNSSESQYVDLTSVEANMFKNLDKANFVISYYQTEADAAAALDTILTPKKYLIDPTVQPIKKFMRVVDLV